MKKVLLLSLSLFCIAAFADTYLAKADLDASRLEPFIQTNIAVVAELEHTAILLIDEGELDIISDISFEILDHNPSEGDYYLIRRIDKTLDLSIYGDILFNEADDFILRVDHTVFEELIKQKVQVKQLFLRSIILSDKTQQPVMLADPTIQEIVDLVDADTVLADVQRLQDFVSRYSTYDSCLSAANWIADKFNAYGLDSVYFQYHTSGHAPNVIGVKHGVLYPDSIYTVICGHYDAISYLAPEIAPGADDNASGTTAALEAARVMQNFDFEYSVRYMAFSGEEFGLYGSEYYAQQAYTRGDSIRGVFNADMIAYSDVQPEDLEVIGKISNPSCDWLADFFIAAADTYTTLLTSKHLTSNWIPSDNQSFLDYGYAALLGIEDYGVTNPWYHSPGDTIGSGYNDNAFCTEVIKAHVAAVSIMAVPYETAVEELTETTFKNQLTVYPTLNGSHFVIMFNGQDPSLAIFDASGRQVKTYNNINEITWYGNDDSGRQLPAGVYFVRAFNKDSKMIKKVVLIR
ncbi:MAG: M28 family peptidase [bacterium]